MNKQRSDDSFKNLIDQLRKNNQIEYDKLSKRISFLDQKYNFLQASQTSNLDERKSILTELIKSKTDFELCKKLDEKYILLIKNADNLVEFCKIQSSAFEITLYILKYLNQTANAEKFEICISTYLSKNVLEIIKKFSSQDAISLKSKLESVKAEDIAKLALDTNGLKPSGNSNSGTTKSKEIINMSPKADNEEKKMDSEISDNMLKAQVFTHQSKPKYMDEANILKLTQNIHQNDTKIQNNIQNEKKPVKIFDDAPPKNNPFKKNDPRKSIMFSFGKPNIEPKIMKDRDACLRISTIKGVKTDNAKLFDELKHVESTDDDFVDESFPPVLSSLTANVKEFPLAKDITWRKISEIYAKKTLSVCGMKIGPNDIKQGKLGDCYYLSALSVLAERRNFITRLFHSKEISKNGLYSLWLCDSGEWKNLLVDSFIPCIKGSPCFSVSKCEDIWVLLLEKAFAKLFGNYYNIDGGHQSEALNALTGAPTKYFKEKTNIDISLEDQMWNFMQNSLSKKFILTGATKGEKQEMEKSMGIVLNHAYSILKIKELTLSGGQKERLIMMRNPWGNHEWKGDWSDNSPQMTNENKRLLEYSPQIEDGTFWINIKDFSFHFDTICSCKVFDNYFFSYLKLGEGRKQKIFLTSMKVEKKCKAYITAQQMLKKHFPDNKNYEYSYIRMVICQVDITGKVIKFIKGKYECIQSLVIKSEFERGDYVIFIEVDWIQNYSTIINLTGYSAEYIELFEISCDDSKASSFYKDWVRAFLEEKGSEVVKRPYLNSSGLSTQVVKLKGDKCGVVGILFKNEEKNMTLNIKTKFKFENMEWIVPKNVENDTVYLKINPQSSEMIIVKSIIRENSSSSYSYEIAENNKLIEHLSDAELIRECKMRGKKNEIMSGKILLYSYAYSGGYLEVHVNNGDKVFQETLSYDVENLLVNGKKIKDYEVKIQPGKEHLINLTLINIFEPTKMSRDQKARFLNE